MRTRIAATAVLVAALTAWMPAVGAPPGEGAFSGVLHAKGRVKDLVTGKSEAFTADPFLGAVALTASDEFSISLAFPNVDGSFGERGKILPPSNLGNLTDQVRTIYGFYGDSGLSVNSSDMKGRGRLTKKGSRLLLKWKATFEGNDPSRGVEAPNVRGVLKLKYVGTRQAI